MIFLLLALATADPGCTVSASAERACVAGDELDRYERQLRAVYRSAWSNAAAADKRERLRGVVIVSKDRTNVFALESAQAAWVKLTDSECLFDAIETRPGTDEALSEITCHAARVRQRIAFLTFLARRLERR